MTGVRVAVCVSCLLHAPVARARTIVKLAATLRLDVVAEGTESAAHVDYLQSLACGFAQGYFFSPALPIDELHAMLRRGSHARV